MNRLIQVIEGLQAKLPEFRKHSLKETPTRTIIIDPVLEALGWQVRDPDEVELEYPTVDGKSVDYALRLNRRPAKPALLVEAKPLDDPLEDVKSITQVVGYATNDGIVWCVLTNGVRWKVYRSVEKCPAPDKLMFEVSLDPRDSQGIPVAQIAEQLWRLSREETAKGTLDAWGEQVFADGKVRKALDSIMGSPPLAFLNIIRKTIGERSIPPQKLRESLCRIWSERGGTTEGIVASTAASKNDHVRRKGGRKGKKPKKEYDEPHHTTGKPRETVELYQALDSFCFSLKPGKVGRCFMAKCVNYYFGNRTFCSIHLAQSGLRVWLWLRYEDLVDPPAFARDVSKVGHWGGGHLELAVSSQSQIEEARGIISKSFDGVAGKT